MGARTGAIPSAIGGRSIELSHEGMVFPVTPATSQRWRGWFRHIVRDQVAVWMVCCFVGLALPCMLSLEFLRNTPVSDHRVAAMVAEGMSARFPDFARAIWSLDALHQLPHPGPLPSTPGTCWPGTGRTSSGPPARPSRSSGGTRSSTSITRCWRSMHSGARSRSASCHRSRSPRSGRSWATSRWGSRRSTPCTSIARSCRESSAPTC